MSKLKKTGLILALGTAGAYISLRWLLPCLLPFLLAWAFAALLEPLVGALHRRGIPRGPAAGVCLLAALGLLGTGVWLLLRRLGSELDALTRRLPEILGRLSDGLEALEKWLEGFIIKAPEGLQTLLERAAGSAAESLSALPMKLSARVLTLLPELVGKAPGALLFLITAVLGTFFISSAYPELLHAGARLLPERFLCRARLLRRDLRRTLGRWLKAQLILLGITFLLLTGAFLLLGLDYALLPALGTAIIDALPVLGTGTVLLPWAAYEMLSGNVPLGLGLTITYGAVTLLHQSIQAKLLGDQLGLHPLATLAAIYVGFRVWGVWGMLTFPIIAISLKQLFDGGDSGAGRTKNVRKEYSAP